MLVYANSLVLKPVDGTDEIVQLVSKWVGRGAQAFVDPTRLAQGVGEMRFKNGSRLS